MNPSVNNILACGTSVLKVFSPKTQKLFRLPIDLDYESEAGWVEATVNALKNANIKGTARIILPDYILFSQITDIKKTGKENTGVFLRSKIKEFIPYEDSEVIWDFNILKETVEKIRCQWAFVRKSILEHFCQELIKISIIPSFIDSSLLLEYQVFNKDKPIAILNKGHRSSHLLCLSESKVFTKVYYNEGIDTIKVDISNFEKMHDVKINTNTIHEEDNYSGFMEIVSRMGKTKQLNLVPQGIVNKLKPKVNKFIWTLGLAALFIISTTFFVYAKSIYTLYSDNKKVIQKEVDHLRRSNNAIMALLNQLSESEKQYKSLLAELDQNSKWVDLLVVLENSINKTQHAWLDNFEKISENSIKIKGSLFVDDPRLTSYEVNRETYELFEDMRNQIISLPLVSEMKSVQLEPKDEYMLNFECTLVLSQTY